MMAQHINSLWMHKKCAIAIQTNTKQFNYLIDKKKIQKQNSKSLVIRLWCFRYLNFRENCSARSQFQDECSYNEAKQVLQAAGVLCQTDRGNEAHFTQVTHMLNTATGKTKLTDVINACSTYTHKKLLSYVLP